VLGKTTLQDILHSEPQVTGFVSTLAQSRMLS
jgi:hypothetical protein